MQEEERCRVARELQDDFSQRLALLASELEQLSLHYPEPREEVPQRLIALSQRATAISGDAYRLSLQLHPTKLEALGLVASLRSYCREVSEQQRIHVSFTHGGVPASIPMAISVCVYRIVQEALCNVAKHSGADEAHVQLLSGRGGVCLRIADDGAGFDPDSIGHHGLGLISISERLRFVGGELHIHSGRSRGTRLDVWIPLARRPRRRRVMTSRPLCLLTGVVTLKWLVLSDHLIEFRRGDAPAMVRTCTRTKAIHSRHSRSLRPDLPSTPARRG